MHILPSVNLEDKSMIYWKNIFHPSGPFGPI